MIGQSLNSPWLIQGDFNAVSCNEDRIGGIPINDEAANEFQNWILGLHLVEVQSTGPKFTWTNYQEGDKRIYRKLDWCFANQSFYSRGKDPSCTVISCSLSDHCGLLVDIQSSKEELKTPFRFFNMWCEHPNFFNIVEKIWQLPVRGCNMYKVYHRLKLVRVESRSLNKREFGHISGQIAQCRQSLEGIRNKLLDDPFNVGMQKEENKLVIQLQQMLNWEECLLKQKSRCQWIQEGDQNSKFFFRMLQQRKARNKIEQLLLANGEISADKDVIKNAILEHYQNFLGTTRARTGIFDCSEFQGMVVPAETYEELCKMATEKEIKEALWSIKDDKCPGPDGYNSYFFKKTWSIIGNEICYAIQDFFLNGAMLRQTNSTAITLIPKIMKPQRITDFRPISCCNVVYKMISKILTGRLRGVLDGIIHMNQSAFIPGRVISENIMVAHELLRGVS